MALKIHGTDNIQAGTVQTQVLASGVGGGPKITSIAVTDSSYTNIDDTAVGLSGGYIKITGTGFVTGCSVIIGATVTTSVSFISSTEVRAQVPAQSAGTYTVYLVNPDGGVGIRVNGLNYSATPTWTTTSPLGDGSIDSAISIQLAATSNSTVTYALQAGSTLPAGLSLSSGGLLSGTVTGITVDTTYNFTVVASDQENQDTPQAFSITISVNDPYFKNTVLLLQADTAPTIISDASANNFDLTVVGDARASNFSPYGTGWSNYFDGSGDYLSTAANSAFVFGTGDFCIEGYFYVTADSTSAVATIVANTAGGNSGWIFSYYTGGFRFQATGIVIFQVSSSLNAWHHVVICRAAGTTSMFIDGARQGTTSGAYTWSDSSTLNIGYRGSDNYFTGYMSSVRLVKGSSVYDPTQTTITAPTAPLTAITNTSLLTCHANRFLDGSTNNFTVTRNGDAKIVSFNPFNITNTGVNGSAYFDGTGDFLDGLTATTAFNLSSGDWTIEAWVYRNVSGANHLILNLYNTAGSNSGLTFYINASNQLVTDNGLTAGMTAGTVGAGQWAHIAIVRNGGTTTGYINGVSVGTTSQAPNAAQYVRISSLANDGGTGTGNYIFNGYISNLRVVKGTAVYTANFTPPTQPLTAIANTQLLTLQYDQPHNNHTFLDASSNQFVITRAGNATQGTFSPFSQTGNSVYFDGTGDYLSIPTNTAFDLPGDFTIEFWVYVVPLAGNSNYHIITRGYYQSGAQDWIIAIGSGDYNTFMSWGNPAQSFSAGFITPNAWFHIAFARSGTTLRGFKNGVLYYSQTNSVNFTNTQAVNIGTNSANTVNNLMNGYISNLRMVKGTALYTTNFTPSTTPLTAVANTSLLTCHANRFIDGSANNFTITRNGDTRVTTFGPFSTTAYSATSNGGSAYFDGTGDYLQLPITALTGQFTIEFWFYRAVTGNNYTFTIGDSLNATGIQIYIGTNGTILNYYTGQAARITATPPDVGSWSYIAATRDSSNVVRLYVNGTQVGGTYTHAATLDTTLRVGAEYYTGAVSGSTNGYISNFRISNTVRTITLPTQPLVTDVNTLCLLNFTDAAIRDSRGLAVLETVGDAKTSTVQVKYGTGSMRFDGTGDYVKVVDTLPFAFGANNFTVEFWMNATTSTNPGRIINYWSTSTATAASWQFLTGGTALFFACGTAGTSSEVNISGTISLNTWTHIAGVRNGNVFTLYINGTQAATSTQAITLQTANTVIIGARNNAGTYAEFFAGYLDDLRITRGQARYTQNFTPPAAKFLAR